MLSSSWESLPYQKTIQLIDYHSISNISENIQSWIHDSVRYTDVFVDEPFHPKLMEQDKDEEKQKTKRRIHHFDVSHLAHPSSDISTNFHLTKVTRQMRMIPHLYVERLCSLFCNEKIYQHSSREDISVTRLYSLFYLISRMMRQFDDQYHPDSSHIVILVKSDLFSSVEEWLTVLQCRLISSDHTVPSPLFKHVGKRRYHVMYQLLNMIQTDTHIIDQWIKQRSMSTNEHLAKVIAQWSPWFRSTRSYSSVVEHCVRMETISRQITFDPTRENKIEKDIFHLYDSVQLVHSFPPIIDHVVRHIMTLEDPLSSFSVFVMGYDGRNKAYHDQLISMIQNQLPDVQEITKETIKDPHIGIHVSECIRYELSEIVKLWAQQEYSFDTDCVFATCGLYQLPPTKRYELVKSTIQRVLFYHHLLKNSTP